MGAGNEWPDRRPVTVYEWVHEISSVDFDESPEIKDSAGKPIKRPAGKTLKEIAWRLGYWGNKDGTQVYAGPARIAVICEVDYKTAKLVLRTLCAYKLITLVQRGGGVATPEREGNGGEYRLTVPHNLRQIALYRTKEEIDALIEIEKEKARNKGPTGKRVPRESRGTGAPVTPVAPEGITGQSTSQETGSRGNQRPDHGAMVSAIPTQYLPVKENQPSPTPVVDVTERTSRRVKEEGEVELSNGEVDEAHAVAEPYFGYMDAVQSRTLTNLIERALRIGWPADSIRRTLDRKFDGLRDIGDGLAGRVQKLISAGKPTARDLAALRVAANNHQQRSSERNTNDMWAADPTGGWDPHVIVGPSQSSEGRNHDGWMALGEQLRAAASQPSGPRPRESAQTRSVRDRLARADQIDAELRASGQDPDNYDWTSVLGPQREIES